MATILGCDRPRASRTETRTLVGYCLFVFDGLACVASFIWLVCLNC